MMDGVLMGIILLTTVVLTILAPIIVVLSLGVPGGLVIVDVTNG